MSDALFVASQYLLPKASVTSFAGHVASAKAGSATAALIRWFVRRYAVDMTEAAEPDPQKYASFNSFFTRALKPGARPISDADLVCPVDGAISQFGPVAGGRIIQAKGRDYSVADLLGGESETAAIFQQGNFATIYLSPRDYHRIHMPCRGRLREMIHVPGDLFSVNPATARGVPNLFARNERVVCHFDSSTGPFAMVLVGATIVGSMATVWHGVVNPPRHRVVRRWNYQDREIVLDKGEEMGRFLLGSTVVLLFPQRELTFNPAWAATAAVRLGEPMARWGR